MERYLKKVHWEKIKFGVDFLDFILSGGVVKGSSLLLSSEISTYPESLFIPFVATGLKENENIILINFSRPPEDVLRLIVNHFEENGLNFLEEALKENKIFLMDCYRDYSVEEVTESNQTFIIKMASSAYDPNKLFKVILSIIKKKSNTSFRIVFDNLSTFSLSLGDKVLYKFFRKLLSELKYKNITSLFLVYKDAHEIRFLNTLYYLTDIVIETSRTEDVTQNIVYNAKVLKYIGQEKLNPDAFLAKYEINEKYKAISIDWPNFVFNAQKEKSE